MIPGKGSVVGERFVTHPLVRKVCFTGSTEVGKQIMAGCADQVKRVTLELGGKSANIVFADTDLAAAAASAPYAVFDNAGQDCCARSRILVERVGVRRVPRPPRDRRHGPAGAATRPTEDSEMGPLISAGQRESVRATSTTADGGVRRHRRPTGRASGCRRRWSLSTDTADPIWREEVFGPVVAVMPFDDEDARDRAGQRQRLRPVRLDLHPRPRPRRCGSRAASRPATSA